MKRETIQTAVDLAICAVVLLLYLSICHVAKAQVTAKKFGDDHPPMAPLRLAIEVSRVVDGDTVEAQIFMPWSTAASGTIRLLDFDAWESSKRRGSVDVSDDEVKKGKAAARALQECLDLGNAYAEPLGRGTHDNYGRMLARLWVKTDEGKVIEVSKWMKERGHCRPDKEAPGFKPAKPVKSPGPTVQPRPKSNGGAGRASKRLDQLASQPRGLQVPQGAGGFGGYEPQCQKTRSAMMARR